ncbi:transglutaminase family protein [Phenylobacterium sp.]|jgi:transglutaminase-like putative cysteine protease|uniref:transglutaminase family protein n=1 Tax=Phenylobacterium sp. TaxID=1871053 RepID=UPI002F94BBC2
MPVVSIRHRTAYRYRRPVAFGEHRMMFRPLDGPDQRVISAALDITPEPHAVEHVQDAYGAQVGVAQFGALSDELVFESRVLVDHRPQPVSKLISDAIVDPAARRVEGAAAQWASRFLSRKGRPLLLPVLTEMSQAIRRDFAYGVRLDGGPRTPDETLEAKGGSCRDFAVLMMAAVRSLGVPARFVSGYLYSAAAREPAAAGHTHAWVRAHVPGCGWVDLDPTNGTVGAADLIRVAVVANPLHALPLQGAWSGDPADYLGMDVEVEVGAAAAEAVAA